MLKTLATTFATLALMAIPLHANTSIYDIPLVDINGNDTSLAEHKGKVMLIVNVASKCGYTRQYEGLEKLHKQYSDKGVVVLGFPCNQFGGQEPGSETEIMEFCRLTYGVSFPMYSKIKVNGDDRHPLYELLAGKASPFPGNIGWNFSKFLIGKDGTIAKRYSSRVKPLSEELLADIEKELNS